MGLYRYVATIPRAAHVAGLALPALTGRVAPIYVLQMGKVGSSTVVASLNAIGRRAVFHIHTIEPGRIRRSLASHRTALRSAYPEHLLESALLTRTMLRADRLRTRPHLIITLVREPLSRLISHLFQNKKRKGVELVDSDGHLDASRFEEIVRDRLGPDSALANPKGWFDRELRDAFGIDVFASLFDPARGYATFERGSTRVLLMRLEDLDRVLPVAAQEFLALPEPLRVVHANEASSKQHAEEYKRFCRELKLPAEQIDRVYGSPFARHFYADRIASLRARWLAGESEGGPASD